MKSNYDSHANYNNDRSSVSEYEKVSESFSHKNADHRDSNQKKTTNLDEQRRLREERFDNKFHLLPKDLQDDLLDLSEAYNISVESSKHRKNGFSICLYITTRLSII